MVYLHTSRLIIFKLHFIIIMCGSRRQKSTIIIFLSFFECPTAECRGRSFTPLRSSPLTQTIDWQTVRIQEISGDDRREAGRIPRTIECELTADLVDSCVPGDMVTITAVVKATGSEEGQ